MNHSTLSGVVSIVAIVAAVVVQVVANGDPTPYLGIATAAVGYAVGNAIGTSRAKR